ncbi:hypothetical protein LOD99_5928 [Oopsacas minuta]|uniref:Uncharacterized protein n=1 Tax=Oopsacas minuta TaxID=111878 RepID=A0AAV7JN92_9METZ|nr:hypothetical protein LOD99_5928 [Oopsacas minuta]
MVNYTRYSTRLSEPSPRRLVLFSRRSPPSPPPGVVSHPFSYPDPLADPTDNPIIHRVQEFRRLQSETIAFEVRKRRPNLFNDTRPKIRPSSASGPRRSTPKPVHVSSNQSSPSKPVRPNSARQLRPRSARGHKTGTPVKISSPPKQKNRY